MLLSYHHRFKGEEIDHFSVFMPQIGGINTNQPPRTGHGWQSDLQSIDMTPNGLGRVIRRGLNPFSDFYWLSHFFPIQTISILTIHNEQNQDYEPHHFLRFRL